MVADFVCPKVQTPQISKYIGKKIPLDRLHLLNKEKKKLLTVKSYSRVLLISYLVHCLFRGDPHDATAWLQSLQR